jgi:hypothetical protein
LTIPDGSVQFFGGPTMCSAQHDFAFMRPQR